jgi:hypothetical protein
MIDGHLPTTDGRELVLARRLHGLAPGLTPRSVLEKFAAVLTRYTEPEPELTLLPEETQTGAAHPTTPQNHRCTCAAEPLWCRPSGVGSSDLRYLGP